MQVKIKFFFLLFNYGVVYDEKCLVFFFFTMYDERACLFQVVKFACIGVFCLLVSKHRRIR